MAHEPGTIHTYRDYVIMMDYDAEIGMYTALVTQEDGTPIAEFFGVTEDAAYEFATGYVDWISPDIWDGE